jgi:hypothetical protein
MLAAFAFSGSSPWALSDKDRSLHGGNDERARRVCLLNAGLPAAFTGWIVIKVYY